MKKLFITLFLSIGSFIAFTQNTFTEKIFLDMMGRYQKETAQFLKTETSPEFIFAGSNGQTMSYTDFLKFVDGSSAFLKNEFTNIKIRQFDNTAIVTANWAHSHQLKHDSSIVSYKELATETFVRQKGKWMYVSHQSSEIPPTKMDEEAAVKAVIEKETQTWMDRDVDARLTCFANVPYSNTLIYHGVIASNNGVAYSTNEKMEMAQGIKAGTAAMGAPDKSTFTNTNYVIHIKGNISMAYFDQIVTSPEGKKSYFHEVRNVEKINGAWKIIYVGAVKYIPEEAKNEEADAIKKAIEEEASQFHINTDRNVFLKSWNMVDGTIMVYSGKTGLTKLSGKDIKSAAEKGVIPKANGEVTKFSNYVVRTSGNVGWASFDQTSAKGIVTHEFRMMEKVGNDWKIVSSSVHDTAK
jgi:Domain of unknown function (DUF4440)